MLLNVKIKQINFLNVNPDVGILGSWFEPIDAQSQPTGKIVKFPMTHECCLKTFKKRNPVNHPCVAFRASVFKKIGLYPNKYKNNEDTNLWCQAFKHNIQFANLPEVLLYFRITPSLFKRRKKCAYDNFINKLQINKELSFGIGANIYAFFVFLIKVQPLFISKTIYKMLR